MTIPDRPLELTIDPLDLTLDELCKISPSRFDPVGFRAFLIDNTGWTAEEIGGLTVRELNSVAGQLATAMQKAAVPLAS